MRVASASEQLPAFSEALASEAFILSGNHGSSGSCTYLEGKGQQLFRPSQGAAPQSQQQASWMSGEQGTQPENKVAWLGPFEAYTY